MPSLRYTLLTDGTSDRALMPILRWVLLKTGTPQPLAGEWADPNRMKMRSASLSERMRQAIDLYPCDLLFIHRDAEGQAPNLRYKECQLALSELNSPPPAICVVPVRMTEAWLLSDIAAIRRAADNPYGKVSLVLPALHQLESIPDPKQKLQELLRTASEAKGRRLDRFRRDEASRRLRVAELTTDYEALLSLPAFKKLYEETIQILGHHAWL